MKATSASLRRCHSSRGESFGSRGGMATQLKVNGVKRPRGKVSARLIKRLESKELLIYDQTCQLLNNG
jgi:hypothetical protein